MAHDDTKLTPEQKQALIQRMIRNHEGKQEEASNDPVIEALQHLSSATTTRTLDMPCPQCGKNTLQHTRHILSTYWTGGHVQCSTCSYRDSFMSALGRSILRVEPMPDPAPKYSPPAEEPTLQWGDAPSENPSSKILLVSDEIETKIQEIFHALQVPKEYLEKK